MNVITRSKYKDLTFYFLLPSSTSSCLAVSPRNNYKYIQLKNIHSILSSFRFLFLFLSLSLSSIFSEERENFLRFRSNNPNLHTPHTRNTLSIRKKERKKWQLSPLWPNTSWYSWVINPQAKPASLLASCTINSTPPTRSVSDSGPLTFLSFMLSNMIIYEYL